MGKLILTLAVLALVGTAFYIIYRQLVKSPRFRKFIGQEETHDEFIDKAEEVSGEAHDRIEVSEAARAKLREDEKKLGDIFPGSKE
jgi:hypothetical protein